MKEARVPQAPPPRCPTCGHKKHGVIRCRDGGCECIYTSDTHPTAPRPERMSDADFNSFAEMVRSGRPFYSFLPALEAFLAEASRAREAEGRLRALIEKAPHEEECFGGMPRTLGACSCWQSKVKP